MRSSGHTAGPGGESHAGSVNSTQLLLKASYSCGPRSPSRSAKSPTGEMLMSIAPPPMPPPLSSRSSRSVSANSSIASAYVASPHAPVSCTTMRSVRYSAVVYTARGAPRTLSTASPFGLMNSPGRAPGVAPPSKGLRLSSSSYCSMTAASPSDCSRVMPRPRAGGVDDAGEPSAPLSGEDALAPMATSAQAASPAHLPGGAPPLCTAVRGGQS
mmetsp:Transcript_4591/g.18408  ORF Transcript_4591/g.18408 Transcript_4591/m.18408 type:complete len:214 (-) Transcript_4591:43-684(-)